MHTKGTIHRREAGIKSLALAFNRLIDTMSQLRKTHIQYREQRLPEKVKIDQLFRLDVFSNIWEDDGLLIESDVEELWRTQRSVREGINAMLELDRCVEEDERLRLETKALADWVLEEVEVAGRAFEDAGE
jgi:hypothetical protein